MSKTKESKLEEQVEKFMNDKGIWQLARYQAQSNQNGLPDRLYLYKGFLLGLELKADGGKPTKLQLKKLKAINDNGGIGLIVKDVEIVEYLIDMLDFYTNIKQDYILKWIINYMEETDEYKGIHAEDFI
jgi:hypothetical protein